LRQVNLQSVVDQFQDVAYLFLIGLFYKDLCGLAELLLGTENRVLVGSLDQRNYHTCRLEIHLAGVYKLHKHLHYVGLNIGYLDFSLGTLNKGSIEHGLKDLTARCKNLSVGIYELGFGLLLQNRHLQVCLLYCL